MTIAPGELDVNGRRIGFATALLALLAGSGCVNDLIAVKGRISDPAPQVGFIHETLGTSALEVQDLDYITTNPNGDFSVDYGSSIWVGNVNFSTGAFDATLTYYYDALESIHDVGQLTFNAGRIVTADYTETRAFADATTLQYRMRFAIISDTLNLHGVNLDDGTVIDSSVQSLIDRLQVHETWTRPSVSREIVNTAYFGGGSLFQFQQDWTRDDFATDVAPDIGSTVTINADNSGVGTLTSYFDHGITRIYHVSQSSDGSSVSTLTYEDPTTLVSPDGLGSYSFDANNVGTGTYAETYDDGSRYDVSYKFYVNGATDETYSYDDVSTPFKPDLDGKNDYLRDGSGQGLWHVHDKVGVTQTCQYFFDSSGTVSNLACNAGPAIAATPAMAARARGDVPPPELRRLSPRRAYSFFANSRLGS
jgi:hypothetical protein